MSWKQSAVRVFPSNCEWEVMQAVFDRALTAAEIAEKSSVTTVSIAAILTRAQIKGLIRRLAQPGTRTGAYGLTAYGEQLVKVTRKFGTRRA